MNIQDIKKLIKSSSTLTQEQKNEIRRRQNELSIEDRKLYNSKFCNSFSEFLYTDFGDEPTENISLFHSNQRSVCFGCMWLCENGDCSIYNVGEQSAIIALNKCDERKEDI